MKNKIIIFDIDETITKKNLHELVIDEWIGSGVFRKYLIKIINAITQEILFGPLKRRFEYFPIVFINDIFIKKTIPTILNNSEMVNNGIIKRIKVYKKKGYKVLFITAAPEKTSNICAQYFEVEVESSTMKFGFITKDLLAKKANVYERLITNNYEIKAIYSDSKLDLSRRAKKNILVDAKGIGKLHYL